MKVSRFFLFATLTLVLALLTAACGAEGGATPTLVGTTLPEDILTSTPLGTDTTETAATAETPTSDGTSAVDTTATADGSPTAASTDGTATAVGSPAAGTTQTPGIPVTGPDILLVECQFCVDTWAHALLVLPDTATFQIVSPDPATTTSTAADMQPSCSTVEVNNGRQVVLCSGPEMTPMTLNICTDVNTCVDFPVDLLACPLTQQPGTGAATAAPNQTQPAGTEETGVTTTPTTGVVISTATP